LASKTLIFGFLLAAIPFLLILDGCGDVKADPQAEAPPGTKVVPDVDITILRACRPVNSSSQHLPFPNRSSCPLLLKRTGSTAIFIYGT
jgi:hypothetical protein